MSLQCRGLSVESGRTPASGQSQRDRLINDVNLTIASGQITLLVGRTGAGKSTLLRSLAGLVRPATGSVTVDGHPLWGKRHPDVVVLKRIEFVFQAPERQFFRSTLAAEFDYSLHPFHLSTSEARQRVDCALQSVRLPAQLLAAPPTQLSGGQERRSALATSIATTAPWYLLDEPTSGLDGEATQAVLDWAVSAARERDAGLIVATHDLDAWIPIADRVVLLNHGRIVTDTTTAELATQPNLLLQAGVGLPDFLSTSQRLRDAGWPLPNRVLSPEALAELIVQGTHAPTTYPRDLSGHIRMGGAETTTTPQREVAAPSNRIDHVQRHVKLDDLDPRSKWLSYVVLSVSLVSVHLLALIPGSVGCFCLLRYGRVRVATVWRFARVFVLFMLMAVAFAGASWRPAGNVPPTTHGLSALMYHLDWSWTSARNTLVSLYRVLLILLLGVVFAETTSALQMKKGLESALRWLQPLKIPVEAIAFGASLVLRFVPLLADETTRFAEIAQMRGKRAGTPGRIRLRDTPSVFAPLLLAVFRLGEDLALAMEARGLQEFGRRTIRPLPRPRPVDMVVLTTVLAGAAILWVIP